MRIHVEEKVIRQTVDMTDRKAIDDSYRKAVSRSVDYLLEQEWEVRESKASFRIYPVGCPESAGSIAEVKIREGRKDYNRKVADAIALLPRVIRLLDEAGLCINDLLEMLPYGSRLPDRVRAFMERLMAAEAAAKAEEGGAV